MPRKGKDIVEVDSTIDTGKATKLLMDARGMTARDLSISYGCSSSHIHNIIAKGTNSLTVIERLSHHLDVDVKTFIEYGECEDEE